MARHRKWPIALVVPGVALLAGSFWFTNQMLPDLKKLPTDLKSTTYYEGNVTLYVDPATNLPLSTPRVLPLTVTRVVAADPAASDSTNVVMRETLHMKSEGLFDSTQEQQYVMNRTTALNVKDPRAFAFVPTNVVDRTNTYYLAFGLGMDKYKDQPTYKNEAATQYVAAAGRPDVIEGLTVAKLGSQQSWTPMSDAYLADLNKSVPLPTQLTLDQLKPLLASQGLNVDAVLAGLVPKLAPEDLQTLVKVSQSPIPLNYVTKWGGSVAVDPVTGAPVDVMQAEDVIGAKPASSWIDPLTTALGKYPQVPEAVTLSTALKATAANPIPVFSNTYHQTAASVTHEIATAKDNGKQLQLAETTLPIAMVVVGGLLTLLGVLLIALPKRGEGGTEPVIEVTPPLPAEALDEELERV